MKKYSPGSLWSLTPIWCNLAKDLGVKQTYQDEFEQRVLSEGWKFLTVTLPQLGKDLDQALITGEQFQLTARFKKKSGSALPLFLNNMFRHVFSNHGWLRHDASPRHIKLIRQLTLMFYKLEVQYEENLLSRYYNDYIDRDSSLTSPLPNVEVSSRMLENARAYLSFVLPSSDGSTRKLVPRHGPGATACRTVPWDKYHKAPRFIQKLNEVFDYSETFFFNATHLADELDKLLESGDLDQPVARITAVPKDSRGPRLICMEPREMQYVQQGLMQLLYNIVESHPITKGFVNFTNQEVNKNLARKASINKELSTIDLKDASDRVRWDLVQALFPENWVRALGACRTEWVAFPKKTGIPNYGPLLKFASMGSAVCFPVEALVFWAILKGNLPCDVYVYGDDIIVPSAWYSRACALLEAFDLKVNLNKSCHKTNFRESCGGDYFKGYDVGYVKYRKEGLHGLSSHLSFVGFVNEVIDAFGEPAADLLMRYGDTWYEYPHFRTLEQVPLTYRCSHKSLNDVFFRRRWNRDLQKYEYRIPIVKSRIVRKRSHPKFHWCELLRKHLTGDSESRVGEYADGHSIVKEAWRGDI